MRGVVKREGGRDRKIEKVEMEMLISAQTTCHVVLHLPHAAKFNIIQKNVKTEGENMKLKSTRKRDEKGFDQCRNNMPLIVSHLPHVAMINEKDTKNDSFDNVIGGMD